MKTKTIYAKCTCCGHSPTGMVKKDKDGWLILPKCEKCGEKTTWIK